jgi:hypothetical protein
LQAGITLLVPTVSVDDLGSESADQVRPSHRAILDRGFRADLDSTTILHDA